jgi:hypothetical protein
VRGLRGDIRGACAAIDHDEQGAPPGIEAMRALLDLLAALRRLLEYVVGVHGGQIQIR